MKMQNMYAPMAQAVQSRGRGEDTMLVHMTPNEVGGLQQLAMAGGGSLSVNPETGLPEAGFLSNLLPTILGIGLAATGVGAPLAAGLVAGGTTIATGDLGKGLMAGLGAFGGASLAGGLGIGSSIGQGNAFGALSDKAGIFGSNMGAGIQPASNVLSAAGAGSSQVVDAGLGNFGGPVNANFADVAARTNLPPLNTGAMLEGTGSVASDLGRLTATQTGSALQLANPAAEQIAQQAAGNVAKPGFLGKFGKEFGAAARQGLPGGIIGKAAPYMAGYGVLEPLMRPTSSGMPDMEDQEFDVPEYRQRGLRPRLDPDYPEGEITFFDPTGFEPTGRSVYSSRGFAEGDEVSASPGGLGATLAAQLPQYTSMFQTSPGAISGVPFGYGAGQAPSEQIRAQLAAQQTNQPSGPDVGMLQPGTEPDFGFARARNNPLANLAGLGGIGGLGVGGFNFDGLNLSGFDFSNLANRLSAYGEAPQPQPQVFQPQPQPQVFRPQPQPEPMPIETGGFVMPARETAEFGNGSTMAGQDILARLGGMPIQGPGDGVSDSIPAMIDGEQPAALANGETYFPPQTVQAMGGADQLRRLMEQAQAARQQADRGEESPVMTYFNDMAPVGEMPELTPMGYTGNTPKPIGLPQRRTVEDRPSARTLRGER